MTTLEALDARILRWERKLLRYGRTERADYIVHMLNLLNNRRKRMCASSEGGQS